MSNGSLTTSSKFVRCLCNWVNDRFCLIDKIFYLQYVTLFICIVIFPSQPCWVNRKVNKNSCQLGQRVPGGCFNTLKESRIYSRKAIISVIHTFYSSSETSLYHFYSNLHQFTRECLQAQAASLMQNSIEERRKSFFRLDFQLHFVGSLWKSFRGNICQQELWKMNPGHEMARH